jgi:hypothetical protein
VFLLDAGFVNWKWWFNNGNSCFFFMGNDWDEGSSGKKSHGKNPIISNRSIGQSSKKTSHGCKIAMWNYWRVAIWVKDLLLVPGFWPNRWSFHH